MFEDEDQRAGAAILMKSLSEPCCQVAENAGVEGAVVLSKIVELTKEKGVSRNRMLINAVLYILHDGFIFLTL